LGLVSDTDADLEIGAGSAGGDNGELINLPSVVSDLEGRVDTWRRPPVRR
jgi:hypothetical protein